MFFSRVNFVCWPLFGVCSTPVLPQWHVKKPGHSSKSARGRLHLNTHTPLTERSRRRLTMPLCRQSLRTYEENELTRNSSGNSRPHSSQLVEPLWNTPGLKSGISVRDLISTSKKKKKKRKKVQVENELLNILPKSSHARKKPAPWPKLSGKTNTIIISKSLIDR